MPNTSPFTYGKAVKTFGTIIRSNSPSKDFIKHKISNKQLVRFGVRILLGIPLEVPAGEPHLDLFLGEVADGGPGQFLGQTATFKLLGHTRVVEIDHSVAIPSKRKRS